VCHCDGDFLARFKPLADAPLKHRFRSSDMPKKTPRRTPDGQVAPHDFPHILSACTAAIWAMAGRVGDNIPLLSHDQNVPQAYHAHRTRVTDLAKTVGPRTLSQLLFMSNIILNSIGEGVVHVPRVQNLFMRSNTQPPRPSSCDDNESLKNDCAPAIGWLIVIHIYQLHGGRAEGCVSMTWGHLRTLGSRFAYSVYFVREGVYPPKICLTRGFIGGAQRPNMCGGPLVPWGGQLDA
jgi:hypothetical protein